MATAQETNTGIFGRVGSLLRPSTRSTNARSPSLRPTTGDASIDEKALGLTGDASTSPPSSRAVDSTKSTLNEELDAHDRVRTLPPWIHSLAAGEDKDIIDPNESLLPREPKWATMPQRNFHPQSNSNAPRGRRYDHARNADAVVSSSPYEHASRWRTFMQASAYGRVENEKSEIVDDEWRRMNLPDLDTPWELEGMRDSEENPDSLPGMWLFSPQSRAAKAEKVRFLLMNNPFVPLVIRLIVLIFVGAALGLGATIYAQSKALNSDSALTAGVEVSPQDAASAICKQQPSTYMSFIVSAVAIPYIAFITQDEYFSKPLGLRSSQAKMRLLFLDLFFIVFSAANLALAFDTLTDQQWACFDGNPLYANDNNSQAARSTCIRSSSLCRRQSALVGVLLIVLVAWLLTFATSTMRVVERISK